MDRGAAAFIGVYRGEELKFDIEHRCARRNSDVKSEHVHGVAPPLQRHTVSAYSKSDTGDGPIGSRPTVTARDLVVLRRAMFNSAPNPASLEQLDINRDGVINVRDFLLARGSLFASLPLISPLADELPA